MSIGVQVAGLIASLLFVGYFIMFNRSFLESMSKSQGVISKLFFVLLGGKIRQTELKFSRRVALDRKSSLYKVYKYFYEILVNLDMIKTGVTVTGLLFFITCSALAGAIAICYLIDGWNIFLYAFGAVFYLVTITFRFMSITQYEKREAYIMDAIDLMVSDIRGGVANSIVRYRDSFHPAVRPYFLEFIDNMQMKGYGFDKSMLILNDSLGLNFDEFAQKAIMYEAKADDSMDEIFSTIIEANRHIRTLRYENGLRFRELRIQFLASIGIIGCYIMFSVAKDPFIQKFIAESTFGKILIVSDVVVIAGVMGYLASIKSKSL